MRIQVFNKLPSYYDVIFDEVGYSFVRKLE